MFCESACEQVTSGMTIKVVIMNVDVEVRVIGCGVACGQWVGCGIGE